MTPKLSLILIFVTTLIAVAIALIAISLGIAALLPREHPAADALRRFARQVPHLAFGSGNPVFRIVVLALLLLFPLLTMYFS
ncbi:hypothetical protein ABL841_17935 [Variovorax paradoxus]|uniref:hypothetical protein n=1 Tax=Variovorax paradoxus TaxID=34073 RepID=UPI0003606DFF|nr:hypothetical protein [Variovorax paradoxus]